MGIGLVFDFIIFFVTIPQISVVEPGPTAKRDTFRMTICRYLNPILSVVTNNL